MAKLNLPVVITPTRAELAARCHRRHFLSDILGKTKYFSPSLEFGSVAHAGFAAHWLKQDVNSALAAEWSKREIESEDLTLPMAEKMLEHYTQNALIAGPLTDQGNFKLVDCEQRFEIPLSNDIKLSFQCDRIVHDKDQNWMVIVDSKTVGERQWNSRWERQWETSLQMKLYKAGANQVFQTGGRIDIVVEGVLKHVPSNVRYFLCPEWSKGLLDEAAFNAYVLANLDQELLERAQGESLVIPVQRDELDNVKTRYVTDVKKATELAVRYTPVNYFDCYAYGIECPFRRICTADVDDRVKILNEEYFDVPEDMESY